MTGGEQLARYSFVGTAPLEAMRVGDAEEHKGDPLVPLEALLQRFHYINVPGVELPAFTGGAVGYVAYDCVRFFEPRTAPHVEAQQDRLGVPDAMFMLFRDIVVFDHARTVIKVGEGGRASGVPAPLTSAADREPRRALAGLLRRGHRDCLRGASSDS